MSTLVLHYELFPEARGVANPPLGTCSRTGAKTMADIWVSVIVDRRTGPSQRRDPPFHDRWRRDAVTIADNDESWWFIRRMIGMTGVGHHYGSWLGEILSSKLRLLHENQLRPPFLLLPNCPHTE